MLYDGEVYVVLFLFSLLPPLFADARHLQLNYPNFPRKYLFFPDRLYQPLLHRFTLSVDPSLSDRERASGRRSLRALVGNSASTSLHLGGNDADFDSPWSFSHSRGEMPWQDWMVRSLEAGCLHT
jgi:hypothetical protein